MAKRPMTADDLWRLPRVGGPCPSPDGAKVVVTVSTLDPESSEMRTRLWLVDAKGGGEPRALTSTDASASQPAWSPSGDRLAFVRKPGGEKKDSGPDHPDAPQLYVLPLAGGEPERLTDLPLGVADPRWFPDGQRIAFLSQVYRDAPTLEKTAERKKERENAKVKAHVTEDRFYRFWDHWLTEEKFHHLFVLDVGTRDLHDLTPKMFRHMGLMDASDSFDIAPDGSEIAFGAMRSNPPYRELISGAFLVDVPPRGKKARPRQPRLLAPAHAEDSMRPVYSPDGRFVVYGIQRDLDFYADKVRLVAYVRDSGEHVVLTEDWEHSAGGWTFDADGKWLWLVAEVDARTAIFKMNVAGAAKNPSRYAPREVIRGGSYGAPKPAGGKVFAGRSSLSEPPEVFAFGETGGEATRLTRFTADVVEELSLSAVEDVRFTGAEGREVQMYLLYPPGERALSPRSKREPRYSLVHMIHGGPHGTFGDVWHWRWCAQAVAAAGHLVACVNFHGSTSFGQEFAASILGRWGDQPYADIEAATDHLLDRGLADPKRMAVTGGSYGGYLVSWITSQTKRYACAINHAGVCDFQTQYASDVVHHRARSMGGEPWANVEGMDRYNPMRHAKGFRTPTLVIHGVKDYRVPYNQGLEVYNVLKAKGVPARLVVYPDENHWILKADNSKHWYGEFLGWLERWLAPAAKKRSRR